LQVAASPDLPDVPVMPDTLLLLDLMVQETCVDLHRMSQLVLADVGATLQILRLAGRHYGTAEDRPVRISDCISDLGLRASLKAVSAQTISRHGRQNELAIFWDHSREVAHHSRLLAEEMLEVDPEEAYLAGLLHGIGFLPGLLQWKESGVADPTLTAVRLAKRWAVPRCVTELCNEMQMPGYDAGWSGIVRKAHLRAEQKCSHCLFEQSLGPRLHRIAEG
jgi:hypothetical protein